MSERDQSTATIDRDLAAIEEALSAGVAEHGDPAARELQELALALRADAPEPAPEFARELRQRVENRFPPAPGSLGGARASLRERLRPGTLRRALPAMGVIAAIVVPLVVVVSLAGSPDDGSEGGGDSGGGSVAAEDLAQTAPGGGGREIAPAQPSGGGFAPGQSNRKIERSVGLELEAPVDELARVAEQVTSVTNRHGGFVLNSSLSTGDEGAGGDFELRIPSNGLRPALRDLSALATVRSQSQSGRDVTREHVTARDRLQAARAERRSLLRRLEDADTDEEAEAIRTPARHRLRRDKRSARPAARPAPAHRLRGRDGDPARRGGRRRARTAARRLLRRCPRRRRRPARRQRRRARSGCWPWRCRSA